MMPILSGERSADIRHNIAQDCQVAPPLYYLPRHTGEVPRRAEGESRSQSVCRFQIVVLHKSSVWLSPSPTLPRMTGEGERFRALASSGAANRATTSSG